MQLTAKNFLSNGIADFGGTLLVRAMPKISLYGLKP
jgi:hypothetical protein